MFWIYSAFSAIDHRKQSEAYDLALPALHVWHFRHHCIVNICTKFLPTLNRAISLAISGHATNFSAKLNFANNTKIRISHSRCRDHIWNCPQCTNLNPPGCINSSVGEYPKDGSHVYANDSLLAWSSFSDESIFC